MTRFTHLPVMKEFLLIVSSLVLCLASGLFAEEHPFYPDGTYDAQISTPEEVLGFAIGERPARHAEVVRYFKTLAEQSPYVELYEYGNSYENRGLLYAVVSSRKNLENLSAINQDIQKLADPRLLESDEEAQEISRKSPAIAWLQYSIHGDELSSTDAAIQLLYQLAAGTDQTTTDLRQNLVIGINPLLNPDGRERFLSQVQQWNGREPNPDGQSIQHTTVWPWGRGNHYLFDLNRDWFTLANIETRAHVKMLTAWNPQLFVDSHEMGGYDTYLFPPAREPINRNINPRITWKWIPRFAEEHSRAFDEYGWSYYTREWNDDWYPGYGSSWGRYHDAVGILYEQAGVDGTLLKRPDGTVLTYQETVHHHFVSSMANLKTAGEYREELLHDYYQSRKEYLTEFDRGETRAYYIVPRENKSRVQKLIQKLKTQGIEIYRATNDFKAEELKTYWGKGPASQTLPAGTYIIPLAQPLRPFINSILEFDPRMVNKALEQERESLLKGEGTTLYEVSTWSLPIAFGVEAYTTTKSLEINSELVESVENVSGQLVNPEPKYGYLIRYNDDNIVFIVRDLLREGYTIRASRKPFILQGTEYDRGTILIRLNENDTLPTSLLKELAAEYGIDILGIDNGLTETGPDLGGGEFELLYYPKIALITGPQIDLTGFGSMWYYLDRELKIRHSILNYNRLSDVDFRKYNVLILPSTWGGSKRYADLLGKENIQKISEWVGDGGTLIAIENGAAFLADTSQGFSKVALRRQKLSEISGYMDAVQREMMWTKVIIDSASIWGEGTSGPEEEQRQEKSEKSLEKLWEEDEELRLFMPRGVFMNTRLHPEHWLAFGMGESVPVHTYTSYAYLSQEPVETVGRLSSESDLRVSGLLWPEAKERWAQTAVITRERSGNGQIILFANDPFFRAYTYGTARILANAILLGPGFGTSVPVPW